MSRLHAINKDIEACERELGMMGARYLGAKMEPAQKDPFTEVVHDSELVTEVIKQLNPPTLHRLLKAMPARRAELEEAMDNAKLNTSTVEDLSDRLYASITDFLQTAIPECTFSFRQDIRSDKTVRRVSVYVHNKINTVHKIEIIRIRPTTKEGFIACHCRCLSPQGIIALATTDQAIVKAYVAMRPLFFFESSRRKSSPKDTTFDTLYINGSGVLSVGEKLIPYTNGIEGLFMKILKSLYSRTAEEQRQNIAASDTNPEIPHILFASLHPSEPYNDPHEPGHLVFGREHWDHGINNQFIVNHTNFQDHKPFGPDNFEDIPRPT
jgi:hypothetical protein